MWPEKSQSKVLEILCSTSLGPIQYRLYYKNVPSTMDVRFRVPNGPIGKKLFVSKADDDPFNSLL